MTSRTGEMFPYADFGDPRPDLGRLRREVDEREELVRRLARRAGRIMRELKEAEERVEAARLALKQEEERRASLLSSRT